MCRLHYYYPPRPRVQQFIIECVFLSFTWGCFPRTWFWARLFEPHTAAFCYLLHCVKWAYRHHTNYPGMGWPYPFVTNGSLLPAHKRTTWRNASIRAGLFLSLFQYAYSCLVPWWGYVLTVTYLVPLHTVPDLYRHQRCQPTWQVIFLILTPSCAVVLGMLGQTHWARLLLASLWFRIIYVDSMHACTGLLPHVPPSCSAPMSAEEYDDTVTALGIITDRDLNHPWVLSSMTALQEALPHAPLRRLVCAYAWNPLDCVSRTGLTPGWIRPHTQDWQRVASNLHTRRHWRVTRDPFIFGEPLYSLQDSQMHFTRVAYRMRSFFALLHHDRHCGTKDTPRPQLPTQRWGGVLECQMQEASPLTATLAQAPRTCPARLAARVGWLNTRQQFESTPPILAPTMRRGFLWPPKLLYTHTSGGFSSPSSVFEPRPGSHYLVRFSGDMRSDDADDPDYLYFQAMLQIIHRGEVQHTEQCIVAVGMTYGYVMVLGDTERPCLHLDRLPGIMHLWLFRERAA